jgi:hypothetical protein
LEYFYAHSSDRKTALVGTTASFAGIHSPNGTPLEAHFYNFAREVSHGSHGILTPAECRPSSSTVGSTTVIKTLGDLECEGRPSDMAWRLGPRAVPRAVEKDTMTGWFDSDGCHYLGPGQTPQPEISRAFANLHVGSEASDDEAVSDIAGDDDCFDDLDDFDEEC